MSGTLVQRLDRASVVALWLFAAVTALSVAMQNVFFVGLAAWLAARLLRDGRLPALPTWGWVWVAFLVWALVASALAPNSPASLFTWRKWLLAVAAWCAMDALAQPLRLRAVLGALLAFSALWNLGAVLWYGAQPLLAMHQGMPWSQVADQWIHATDWRARGGSGGYMVLAACDALLIAFYAGLLAQDPAWRRPRVWACLGLLAMGLLLTMTRGAWLAAGLGLGGLLLFKRPRLALGTLALLLGLAWAFPGSVIVRRLASVTDADNDSNRERIYMAQAGMDLLREHPWLGVGDSLSSFERTLPDGSRVTERGYFLRYRRPDAVAWYRDKQNRLDFITRFLHPEIEYSPTQEAEKEAGHLHNTPLQLAVMYGLPGLGLALLFFGGLFIAAARAARDAGLAPLGRGAGLGLCLVLIVFFGHGLTEYNLGSFQSSFTLWFVVGLAFAAIRVAKTPA